MKKILCGFTILLIFLISGCSSKMLTLSEIKKSNKLIVTTNAEFAPFEYMDGINITGIDIDIIKAYANYIGVKIDIRDVDFDAALLAVSTNKSDVAIAAITKSPSREETLLFSDSYYTASQVLIVRNDSYLNSFSTKEELLDELSKINAKIGCQRGTTSEYFIEGNSEWGFDGITGASCITFDNGGLAVKALSNGTIDAVIIDKAPAKLYCQAISGVNYIDIVLTFEEYCIAVNKQNTTLIESINAFIKEMKGNGTIDRIIGKYYE